MDADTIEAERIADGMSREDAVQLFTAVDVLHRASIPEEWQERFASGKMPDLWFLDALLARLLDRFMAATFD